MFFFKKYLVTEGGQRLPIENIKQFSIEIYQTGSFVIIVRFYDGKFSHLDCTKENPKRVRQLLGPQIEIPMHEMLLLDPHRETNPAVNFLIERLKVGRSIAEDWSREGLINIPVVISDSDGDVVKMFVNPFLGIFTIKKTCREIGMRELDQSDYRYELKENYFKCKRINHQTIESSLENNLNLHPVKDGVINQEDLEKYSRLSLIRESVTKSIGWEDSYALRYYWILNARSHEKSAFAALDFLTRDLKRLQNSVKIAIDEFKKIKVSVKEDKLGFSIALDDSNSEADQIAESLFKKTGITYWQLNECKQLEVWIKSTFGLN